MFETTNGDRAWFFYMIGIHNSNIYYPATLCQKGNEHTSNIKNEDFLFKPTKIASVATFSLNPLYSST